MKLLSWLFRKRPGDTVSVDEPISDGVTLGDYLKGIDKRLREVEQGFWRIDKRLQRAGIIPTNDNGEKAEADKVEPAAAPGTGKVQMPQEGQDISGDAELIKLFNAGGEE